MKLPELRPWRSSLTPGTAWPFTSNIPSDVLDANIGISDLRRTFASDRDFIISHCNDFRAYPSIDVRETSNGYRIDADIPGIMENDIDLELHNNVLSIRGKKAPDFDHVEEKESKYIHHERCQGTFYREIAFEKEVNIDNIYAAFTSGVLHVELKKVIQDH
ncbi:MAG: Hsp20/alpha crystallin family protein [Bdellovibrio sp.]|nr:Hsp20/alpha crystallin family protein [Bdellovibrio sp.]